MEKTIEKLTYTLHPSLVNWGAVQEWERTGKSESQWRLERIPNPQTGVESLIGSKYLGSTTA